MTDIAPKIMMAPCTQSVSATAASPPNHSDKRMTTITPMVIHGESGFKLKAPLNAFFKDKTLAVIPADEVDVERVTL